MPNVNYYNLSDIRQDTRVRHEFHDDEWYYSLIDFVAVLLGVDNIKAKNYYHILKLRLKEDNLTLPHIIQRKALTSNNKMYLTDFTNLEGLFLMRQHISERLKYTERRIARTQKDEITILQPRIIAELKKKKWQIEHHVRLPSGHIIDIVATYKGKKYIVECKVRLSKSHLYRAIGQVLCYVHEYDYYESTPIIASYSTEFNSYNRHIFRSLGIEMLEV